MTVTIRVPTETYERLRILAAARNQPIGQVCTVAGERLEAERFWDELEAAYDRLHADPTAAAAYEAETVAWDVTLLDGLENDPWLE